MSKKRIYTVGFELPKDDFHVVEFNSKASLLDADIILFSPILRYQTDAIHPSYKGKPSLAEYSSHQTRESIAHWRRQLLDAFASGKTIIVFLPRREQVFAATGETQYSGTGRNARASTIVGELCNFDSLPLAFDQIADGEGNVIKFTKEGALIKPMWEVLGPLARYHCYFTLTKGIPLLETNSGSKTVGCLLRGKTGHFLILPDIDLPESFTTEREGKSYWTKEAVIFAKRITAAVIALDENLSSTSAKTPTPDWVLDAQYALPAEAKIKADIAAKDSAIAIARQEKVLLEAELQETAAPKDLLFETGKPLERAILRALKIIGFDAAPYKDADSEFDILFSSPEGRFIGEAEGKDSSAINIQKFQQLERNIQEDFAKEGVTEHAKGVLFGNPHRLTPIAKRTEHFTDKVLSAAKRTGAALVLTSDLFPIVQYLSREPNAVYAQSVRMAFSNTSGAVVKFPTIPAVIELGKG